MWKGQPNGSFKHLTKNANIEHAFPACPNEQRVARMCHPCCGAIQRICHHCMSSWQAKSTVDRRTERCQVAGVPPAFSSRCIEMSLFSMRVCLQPSFTSTPSFPWHTPIKEMRDSGAGVETCVPSCSGGFSVFVIVRRQDGMACLL